MSSFVRPTQARMRHTFLFLSERLNMLEGTVAQLTQHVFLAAVDYGTAEGRLSEAYDAYPNDPAMWEKAAQGAKHYAANLAIAIDSLTDRVHHETKCKKNIIRADVSALCFFPGTTSLRSDALARIRGVANAYKHMLLSDNALPIASNADVLVVASGYGVENFGVGKFEGVEVIVRDKAGQSWKFLGDAPTAIGAWIRFLKVQGATLPSGPFDFFGLRVYPGPSD